MSRLEQAGYPYIPGKTGVEFESLDLTKHFKNIKGASGFGLKYKASELGIEVYDAKCPGFYLRASIEDVDSVMFDVQTRVNGLRHRDLYAGKFQAFAIHNLERFGNRITSWISEWKHGSDNYEQFAKACKLGLDHLSAAKSTWTAQSAERNGFIIIRPSSIHEHHEGLTVVFSRA